VSVDCAKINGQTYSITCDFVRVISLEGDWYEDVSDPAWVIAVLNNADNRADIFSFWERLPDTEPRYSYQMERDSIAALPIKSYSFWWEKQIERKARNKVRKAQKQGVTVRMASFDDTFVRGMASIFNETPTRQGRRFLHYGKDFETINASSAASCSERRFSAHIWAKNWWASSCLPMPESTPSWVKLFQRLHIAMWRRRTRFWPKQ
jgi:hypothetical protein